MAFLFKTYYSYQLPTPNKTTYYTSSCIRASGADKDIGMEKGSQVPRRECWLRVKLARLRRKALFGPRSVRLRTRGWIPVGSTSGGDLGWLSEPNI